MSARPSPAEPSSRRLLFYGLLILCGFVLVGKLDYADAVISENARLKTVLAAERAECTADIEQLDGMDTHTTAALSRLEM
jgi:hypothetical protein